MKISSNFSDYYDSMRSIDTDPDPLYVRITKEIDLTDERDIRRERPLTEVEINDRVNVRLLTKFSLSYTDPYGYSHRFTQAWFKTGVIGICGRAYPYVSVGREKEWKYAFNPTKAQSIIAAFNDPMVPNLKTEKQSVLNSFNAVNRWLHYPDKADLGLNTWQVYLDHNRFNMGDKPFVHFRSPVIGYIDRKFFVNPHLKQVDFAQVINVHQVWQELSMYLGNNLANLDRIEPRPITDKLKAETKGFDNWSFKNQKNRNKSERGDW